MTDPDLDRTGVAAGVQLESNCADWQAPVERRLPIRCSRKPRFRSRPTSVTRIRNPWAFHKSPYPNLSDFQIAASAFAFSAQSVRSDLDMEQIRRGPLAADVARILRAAQ